MGCRLGGAEAVDAEVYEGRRLHLHRRPGCCWSRFGCACVYASSPEESSDYSGCRRLRLLRRPLVPNWERGRYRRWAAYGQSKLANLLFAFELEARLAAADSPLRSVAAHPGYAATELQFRTETVQDLAMGVLNRVVAQPAAAGALPTLYAATSPDLPGGSYVGPDGPAEAFGSPRLVGASAATRDPRVRARLWALSETLTGVPFQVSAGT